MSELQCPDCGEQLEPATFQIDQLRSLGYLHRDEHATCSECDRKLTFGVPLEPPTDEPPACPVCGGRFYPYKLDLHHVRSVFDEEQSKRDVPVDDLITIIGLGTDIHWKCEACHYFDNRELEHMVNDVYSLGVKHLEGARDDE